MKIYDEEWNKGKLEEYNIILLRIYPPPNEKTPQKLEEGYLIRPKEK